VNVDVEVGVKVPSKDLEDSTAMEVEVVVVDCMKAVELPVAKVGALDIDVEGEGEGNTEDVLVWDSEVKENVDAEASVERRLAGRRGWRAGDGQVCL
jgi:hypothetical protein